MKLTRPALRYYGGKWRIAPWIISHFPPHHCYVEPFAGAGSVLFRKAPAPFEVLNDLDGNVVNFFQVLRDRTAELKRAIEFTPFSREETYVAGEASEDSLERARRFYIRSWQTQHGAPYLGKNGWRFGRRGGHDRRSAVDDWNDTKRLPAIASRLKNVQIEHDDALKTIARFDTRKALFYCDPPYVASTRRERWSDNGYACELTDEQHQQLSEVLHSIKGMAILSGYPCQLYEELYSDWRKVSIKSMTGRNKPSVEVLWISPAATSRHHQRQMFQDS